jgi:membrane protease YdiL (CAAX protease family)
MKALSLELHPIMDIHKRLQVFHLNKVVMVLVAVAVISQTNPQTSVLPIPFPFRMVFLALLALYVLWAQRDPVLNSFRFSMLRSRNCVFTVLSLAAFSIVILPTLLSLLAGGDAVDGDKAPDVSAFAFTEVGALIKFMAQTWLSAAIGEEIVFRLFLLQQWERMVGSRRWILFLGCLVSSVFFGIAHLNQGLGGVLLTGLVGLSFSAAYYLSRKNILALIIAHGAIDTFGLVALYAGGGG